MAKIISTYENNFNNNKMKKLILEISLNPNEIFDFFLNKDFSYYLLALNQYKLNQSILGNITYIPYFSEQKNSFLSKKSICNKTRTYFKEI